MGRFTVQSTNCLFAELSESVPDLALVVSKNERGNQYLDHTCLTLKKSHRNTRVKGNKELLPQRAA